jgi:O-antigen ligase
MPFLIVLALLAGIIWSDFLSTVDFGDFLNQKISECLKIAGYAISLPLASLVVFSWVTFIMFLRYRRIKNSMTVNQCASFLLIAIVCAIALINLFRQNHGMTTENRDCFHLLFSIFIAQCYSLFYENNSLGVHPQIVALVTQAVLASVLFFACFYTSPLINLPHYHGLQREVGPWSSPNEYGVFMATGVVLLTGIICWTTYSTLIFGIANLTTKNRILRFSVVVVLAIILTCFIYSLIRSFSRGAWLGAATGVSFLIYRLNVLLTVRKLVKHFYRTLVIVLAIIGMCCLVSFFFLADNFNHKVLLRIQSVTKSVDFSWRNRLVAYEASLQMIADAPILGHGWGNTAALYNSFYKPASIADGGLAGAAILTNGFAVFAVSLGVPAFVFFVSYTLTRINSGHSSRLSRKTLLRDTSRAVILVLAIGFFFDGGIFNLAFSSLFFLFAELCALSKEGSFSRQEDYALQGQRISWK